MPMSEYEAGSHCCYYKCGAAIYDVTPSHIPADLATTIKMWTSAGVSYEWFSVTVATKVREHSNIPADISISLISRNILGHTDGCNR